MNIFKVLSLYFLLVNACLSGSGSDKYQHVLDSLQIPGGFSISIYAVDVPNARTLALGEKGVVYVGTRKEGAVYAIHDKNGDGFAEKKYVIATDLNMPNGVAYKDGDLFVAETNKISRYKNIGQKLNNPPKPEVVYDKLPSDEHHGWKYLRFGKDNKLYTAVGAPCNICVPEKKNLFFISQIKY